jgi:hypothetical protein
MHYAPHPWDGYLLREVPQPGPHPAPAGPSRAWADLTALPTQTLRAMAASGLLTAAEQWGAEDELGERDDPYPAAQERPLTPSPEGTPR